MNKTEYELFEDTVAKELVDVTARGTARQRDAKEWKTDARLQVFIFVFYCKHYPTFWLLSQLFGLCELYLCSILKRVCACVCQMAHKYERSKGGISFPTGADLEALKVQYPHMRPPGLENIWLWVDGMRVHIKQPEGRQDLFNQKDKMPSIIFLLGFSVNGDIVYVSEKFENQNENANLKSSGLRKLMLDCGGGVGADAGINFNTESDVKKDGEVLAVWTMGPLALHRSIDLLQKIIHTLYNLKDTLDAAMGKLLEKIAMEIACALHNTKLVSSGRIVSENGIGCLKSWRILSGVFRSYHLEGRHISTLSIQDVVHALCFIRRFIGLQRGFFQRGPQWESKQSNSEPYVPLKDVRNAECWQWRIKQYSGNDDKSTHILDIETGSLLFQKLWERHFDFKSKAESDAEWKKLFDEDYVMSAEFKQRFDKWEVDEDLKKRAEAAAKSIDAGEDGAGEGLLYEDKNGILMASAPHKRAAPSIWERCPHLAYRGYLNENSGLLELKQLELEQLIQIVMSVPSDYDNGCIPNGLCVAVRAILEGDIKADKLNTTFRSLSLAIDNLHESNGKKVLKQHVAKLKKNSSDKVKIDGLKYICQCIHDVYNAITTNYLHENSRESELKKLTLEQLIQIVLSKSNNNIDVSQLLKVDIKTAELQSIYESVKHAFDGLGASRAKHLILERLNQLCNSSESEREKLRHLKHILEYINDFAVSRAPSNSASPSQ